VVALLVSDGRFCLFYLLALLLSCVSSSQLLVVATAAVPASEVETVVRSPTDMSAAKIVAVDFNKMTSVDRPLAGIFVG